MRIVAQSHPAKHRSAVVFCVNRQWLPFAAVAARQIALLPLPRQFDICIASTDPIDLPAPLSALGLRLIRIDIADLLASQKTSGRLGAESYLRLAMPDLLAGDYDRLLYLDADVFVHGGDFNALFRVDLGGRCLGAVRDQPQWRKPQRQKKEFRVMGLNPAAYFNSGVLLIDVPAYRTADITGKALALGRAKGHLFTLHDQSLLNICLYRNWAELSPVWNWQWFKKAPFFELLAAPNIVHFIGPSKPWTEPGKSVIPLTYRKAYGEVLTAFFPDVPPVGVQAHPRMRTGFWWFLAFCRHQLRLRPLLRYLDRFPTETTVHLP
jgi:hypothetical protein